MDKFKEIRPIVLGVAITNNKLLVSEGYDRKRDLTFYRCIGGGIEFGETSEIALRREFKEELDVEIEIKDFLGISENIFEYEGKKAHELILFYRIEIPQNYYQDTYVQHEDRGNPDGVAMWINVEDFKNKSKTIFPDEIFKYL